LQGRTVAVLALPAAPATAPAAARATEPARAASEPDGEVAGVVRGIREAGARVQVLPAADARNVTVAARGAAADAAYVLLVWVTDSDVYRRFAPGPRSGNDARLAATRTSGRRVAVRLALLQLPQARPVWLSSGTGEAWESQTAPSPAARGTGASIGTQTVEDDLREGNGPLYPPPPDPQALSRRLTRRLLASVPWATDVEPN
jgi:hypothetical protein